MGSRGSSKRRRESGTRVLSASEFDNYVNKNQTDVIYRGFSAQSKESEQKYISDMQNGLATMSGEQTSGVGRGLYFSLDKSYAEGYVQRRRTELNQNYGTTVVATIKKGAKIASHNDVNDLQLKKSEEASSYTKNIWSKGLSEKEIKKAYAKMDKLEHMDIGTYARSKGYDAMYYGGDVIVLNQKVLIYKK